MSDQRSASAYWKKNLRLIAGLLSIWFLVSFVFAIFMANGWQGLRMGQLPMGFWWAQQGSMFVFVVLIFIYARQMDRLDREFGLDEDA